MLIKVSKGYINPDAILTVYGPQSRYDANGCCRTYHASLAGGAEGGEVGMHLSEADLDLVLEYLSTIE